MRIKTSILVALGSLTLASISNPALAGGCGNAGAPCSLPVQHFQGPGAVADPMTVRNYNPMGFMRTIQIAGAPNVSITRVHGLPPHAQLADAPSGFTPGCHPASTRYCRKGHAAPMALPVRAPAPVVSHIAPRYVPVAPVVQPAPRTYIGKGFNPANFASRQYGSNNFTPGIAHIPTSIVDRDPVRADMVLNSGRAVPQRHVSGGVAPRPSMVGASSFHHTQTVVRSGPAFVPGPRFVQPPVYGQPSAPVLTGNGTYGSNVGSDGTYWEKTSGPTKFGNTMATQVICKRQLPRQVVRPVIGVPTPVPTPVACNAPMHGQNHVQSHVQNRGVWTY